MLELVTTSQFKKDLKRLQEPARTLICSTEDSHVNCFRSPVEL